MNSDSPVLGAAMRVFLGGGPLCLVLGANGLHAKSGFLHAKTGTGRLDNCLCFQWVKIDVLGENLCFG